MKPLELNKVHLADLQKSGLQREIIGRAGICSASRREMIFPYPGLKFSRSKIFPKPGESPRGPKYLQAPGSGNHLYVPPGVEKLLLDRNYPIYFFEGEKKALRGAQEGLCSVGIPGIYGWKNRDSDELIADIKRIKLRKRKIFLVPDGDVQTNPMVRAGARGLWKKLLQRDAAVEMVALPTSDDGSKTGFDDYLQEHDLEEFHRLPVVPDVNSLFQHISPPGWPAPLKEYELYGVAGRLIQLIAPHTEADPSAMMVNLLVAFGNMLGDGPHLKVGQEQHPLRLFAALVGDTSDARKGTSWSEIGRVIDLIEPGWRKHHEISGLSSGEGLIYAVRDPQETSSARREKTKDVGVTDKRLLVVEPEFARTLKVMARDGNTLSAVLRQAWDSGNLHVMTREALVATGANISILGHVTRAELLRNVQMTELANGFANRFLWMSVRRVGCLPEGGSPDHRKLLALVDELRDAVHFGRKVRQLGRSSGAKKLWAEVYPELSLGRSGLAGAIRGRAEAQVLRLAGIFAILDKRQTVKTRHLNAAREIWKRVEASINFIFGEKVGDPIADTILSNLKKGTGEMSLTKISKLFQNHESSERIGAALLVLEQAGRVVRCKRKTPGRSSEIWALPGHPRQQSETA